MNDKKIEEKITKKEIEIIKSYNKGIKVILDLFNLNNTLKKDINESIKLNLDNNNFIHLFISYLHSETHTFYF